MIESNYSPSMLEKFTTRPWAFFISGRNVLVTSINPHRLTSAMRLYFSNGSHSTGAITVIPALFTSPQSPENGGKQFSFNDRGKEHSAHFGWLFTGPLKKQSSWFWLESPVFLSIISLPSFHQEIMRRHLKMFCFHVVFSQSGRGVGIFVIFRYSVIFHKWKLILSIDQVKFRFPSIKIYNILTLRFISKNKRWALAPAA